MGVLLVAGGLLAWTSSYINNEVSSQLSAQKIIFPAANSAAVAAPEFQAMRQYGGQQLTTGAQAEVYADHFIANHLIKIGGGKTYAQLSTEALSQPTNAKLAAVVNTVFKGEALRGLLLNAYAFGTIGMIAGIAAVVAFIGAGSYCCCRSLASSTPAGSRRPRKSSTRMRRAHRANQTNFRNESRSPSDQRTKEIGSSGRPDLPGLRPSSRNLGKESLIERLSPPTSSRETRHDRK